MLEAREGTPASDLVDIAQIFQRSGTLSVSWKDSNITKPADFKGKKVGVVGLRQRVRGHRRRQEGRASSQGTDYTKFVQPFDMTLLLSKQIDVAEAMIYNEYAQVLEATNPETGELVQADRPQRHQLERRRDRDAPGRAVRARFVARRRPGNEDIATRFLKASFQGWIYCRANPDDCVQYTVNAGSTLGAGHQAWMMNEINPLVWPSPNGIGMMDPALVAADRRCLARCRHHQGRAAGRARTERTSRPRPWPAITDDTKGADFKKGEVQVTEGGN